MHGSENGRAKGQDERKQHPSIINADVPNRGIECGDIRWDFGCTNSAVERLHETKDGEEGEPVDRKIQEP